MGVIRSPGISCSHPRWSPGEFSLFSRGVPAHISTELRIIELIEGVAETTASPLKIASGGILDRIGRRKWLTVGGDALSTVSKPLMRGRLVGLGRLVPLRRSDLQGAANGTPRRTGGRQHRRRAVQGLPADHGPLHARKLIRRPPGPPRAAGRAAGFEPPLRRTNHATSTSSSPSSGSGFFSKTGSGGNSLERRGRSTSRSNRLMARWVKRAAAARYARNPAKQVKAPSQ